MPAQLDLQARSGCAHPLAAPYQPKHDPIRFGPCQTGPIGRHESLPYSSFEKVDFASLISLGRLLYGCNKYILHPYLFGRALYGWKKYIMAPSSINSLIVGPGRTCRSGPSCQGRGRGMPIGHAVLGPDQNPVSWAGLSGLGLSGQL